MVQSRFLEEVAPHAYRMSNSPAEIGKRIREGKLGWRVIILLLVARFVLALALQPLLAFTLFGPSPDPWTEAGRFWPVWLVAIDLATFLLLIAACRREGMVFAGLFGFSRRLVLADIAIGILLALVMLLLWSVGTTLAEIFFLEGVTNLPASPPLPAWALYYALTAGALIAALAEAALYAGYALPRIEVKSGSALAAIGIVVAYWSLQQVALPLNADSRIVGIRFFGSALAFAAACIAALRLRRLTPIVIALWVLHAAQIWVLQND